MAEESSKTTRLTESLERTRLDESIPSADRELPPRIGRFAVLRKLGEGGMGIVYSAYDEELDRRVAIKVVRRAHTDATDRMKREAQAMAKLAHPHVAAVFEVGAWQGQLFLAIEFVKGRTLSQWAAQKKRSRTEIIEVMSQAGRGLQAAHDAGLVHRDFKPDNAMIGDDGRVRVLDFGLADTSEGGRQQAPASMESMRARLHTSSPFDTPLTATGTLMGTPAYMSPEQFKAMPAGPASDQFSFCVTLYELLYGERPFEGDEMKTLSANVTTGKIREPPKSSRVPNRVRGIVLKGLAIDPAERHPDIRTLLAELSRATGVGRRNLRRGLVAGLAVAMAAGGTFAYQQYDVASRVQACEDASASFDEVWNEGAKTKLLDGLNATGISYASTVGEKVTPWLDENARSWKTAKRISCVRRTVDQSWEAPRHAKSQWCLEDHRLRFAAIVETLAAADADALEHAVSAASSLTGAGRCVDDAALAAMPAPPPDELRPAVSRNREELARAIALESEGNYAEGVAAAQLAREEAEKLGWGPLLAHARFVEAQLLERQGKYALSERAALDAFLEAGRASDWDTAAAAANLLIKVVGDRLGRHDEASRWSELSSLAIALSSDPLELREATRLHAYAAVLHQEGEHDRAKTLHRKALAIHERIHGKDHPSVADGLSELGVVYELTSDYDEARAAYKRALEIRKQRFGDQHPRVADSLSNLGNVAGSTGAFDEAHKLEEQALRMRESSLGPDHPSVANSLNAIGILHGKAGELEKAGEYFERALAIKEKAFGPEFRDLSHTLNNIGNVHSRLKNYDQARASFERALAITEKTVGPDHSRAAISHFNIGNIERRSGRLPEAVVRYRKALTIFEHTLGSDHPRVAHVCSTLGLTQRKLGRYAAALDSLERALVIRSKKDIPLTHRSDTQFELAKTLWDAPETEGRDRERALELAQQAREGFSHSLPHRKETLAEAQAWLASHSLP